jgi:hypothetical protein
MVAAGEGDTGLAAALEETMAKKATVFGLEGGNETGPPTRGVRPMRCAKPARKVEVTSKGRSTEEEEAVAATRMMEGAAFCGGCCCGPASMAGERGPARREFASQP